MFKNLQNVVELCLRLDENCRKQRVEKKTKGILGSSFFIRGLQLMTDEWQTQGGEISWGLLLLFTIGIGVILKEIKY